MLLKPDCLKMEKGLIRQLPAHAIDRIRGEVTIGSYAQALCALLSNALDACSTSIDVELDVQSGTICILDDGTGIQDLSLVGQRYCTSKAPQPLLSLGPLIGSSSQQASTTLGFRGEELATLAGLCLELRICSRSVDHVH